MRRHLTLFLVVLSVLSLTAQQDKHRVKTYLARVTLMDKTIQKGILYRADAEGVHLSKTKEFINPDIQTIPFNQITSIKVRRKGSGWIGAGIGFGAGIISSVAFTEAHTDGAFNGFTLLVSAFIALMVAPIGALIGAAIAGGGKNYTIYTSAKLYNEHLPKLQQYSIVFEE